MIYAIITAFILLDILSGVSKALKYGTLSSKIMREGLLHKFSYVLVLALAFLIDYSSVYFDMGFPPKLFIGATIFVCTTETLSIIENVLQILPENIGSPIRTLFHLPNLEKVKDNEPQSN